MSVLNHGIVGFMCSGDQNTIIQLKDMCIILGSITDLEKHYRNQGGSGNGIKNIDDQWILFPGYKIEIYNGSDYTGNSVVLDNTNNDHVKIFNLNSNQRRTNSLKAYYRDNTTPLPAIEDPEWNNDTTTETDYYVHIAGPAN